MAKAESPFLIVNPKSYLYGEKSLELAKAADKTAKETGLQIYFTCPYADIRLIKENTENLIVCAQSMDSLTPGRGMGHVLPESLKEAGAEAISVNEQRIINMSDIVDIGSNPIIVVNQQRIFSPYIIKAIGDPTKLESTLLGNGGYVEILRNFGFKIEIEKSKVSIPKYSKDITNKYIQ